MGLILINSSGDAGGKKIIRRCPVFQSALILGWGDVAIIYLFIPRKRCKGMTIPTEFVTPQRCPNLSTECMKV